MFLCYLKCVFLCLYFTFRVFKIFNCEIDTYFEINMLINLDTVWDLIESLKIIL